MRLFPLEAFRENSTINDVIEFDVKLAGSLRFSKTEITVQRKRIVRLRSCDTARYALRRLVPI